LVAHNGSAKGEDDENRSEKISIMGGRDYYFLVDKTTSGAAVGNTHPSFGLRTLKYMLINHCMDGWMDSADAMP